MALNQALLDYRVSRTGPVTLTQVAAVLASAPLFSGSPQGFLQAIGATLFADVTDTTGSQARRRLLFSLSSDFETNFPGASAVGVFTGMFTQQIAIATKMAVIEATPTVIDFDPSKTGSPYAWFRPDQNVISAGGLISSIGNIIPLGVPATVAQVNPLRQPTLVAADPTYGGQPVISFGGTQNLESIAFLVHPQPTSAYAVGRATTVTSRLIDGTAVTRQSILSTAATKWGISAGVSLATALSSGTRSSLIASFNGLQSEMYVNAYLAASAAGNAGADGLDQLSLGSIQGGGEEMTGEIAEVCLYDGLLEVMQRARLRLYSIQRYNV